MKPVAYLWVGESPENDDVLELLKKGEVDFVTVPVEDLTEPELLVGRLRIRGRKDIAQYLLKQGLSATG